MLSAVIFYKRSYSAVLKIKTTDTQEVYLTWSSRTKV